MKLIALQKVSFSDTQNPKAVFSNTHSPWEALSAYCRQFNANNSDTFISKTKKFLSIFFSHF